MGLRDLVLGTRLKFRRVKVELGELAGLVDGQELWVREMTAAESGEVESARFRREKDAEGKTDVVLDMTADRQTVLVRCICDPEGNRVFGDDDELAIGLIPRCLADLLYGAALDINRLSGGATEKKSPPTPGASSPSS